MRRRLVPFPPILVLQNEQTSSGGVDRCEMGLERHRHRTGAREVTQTFDDVRTLEAHSAVKRAVSGHVRRVRVAAEPRQHLASRQMTFVCHNDTLVNAIKHSVNTSMIIIISIALQVKTQNYDFLLIMQLYKINKC